MDSFVGGIHGAYVDGKNVLFVCVIANFCLVGFGGGFFKTAADPTLSCHALAKRLHQKEEQTRDDDEESSKQKWPLPEVILGRWLPMMRVGT